MYRFTFIVLVVLIDIVLLGKDDIPFGNMVFIIMIRSGGTISDQAEDKMDRQD